MPDKISELRDPNTLKSGHIAELSKGRKVVVKRNKYGNAKYVKASTKDIKCSRSLKKNVIQMLNEVKTKKNKRVKSYSQALAIAYSKTKKKFPNCSLILKSTKTKPKTHTKPKTTNKTTNNISKLKQNGGGKRVKLQRKILKLLIKKQYILKQSNTSKCTIINGNSIKQIYDSKQNIPINIKKIRNKSDKLDLNTLLQYINKLIQNCNKDLHNAKLSYPENSSESRFGFRYSNTYANIIILNNNDLPTKELDKIKYLYKFVKELP